MANQEEAVQRAIKDGDAAAAIDAYAAYADSMARSGQVAKSAKDLGIRK